MSVVHPPGHHGHVSSWHHGTHWLFPSIFPGEDSGFHHHGPSPWWCEEVWYWHTLGISLWNVPRAPYACVINAWKLWLQKSEGNAEGLGDFPGFLEDQFLTKLVLSSYLSQQNSSNWIMKPQFSGFFHEKKLSCHDLVSRNTLQGWVFTEQLFSGILTNVGEKKQCGKSSAKPKRIPCNVHL